MSEAVRSAGGEANAPSSLRPLVVGAPRTGFSLLINVVAHLLPLLGRKPDRRTRLLRAFNGAAGGHISEAILQRSSELRKRGHIVYNPNFRAVAGGPRWIPVDDPGSVCLRKYVGFREHGDISLILRHPRALVEPEDILHTHSHPAYWVTRKEEECFTPLACVRSPVGTLYSSCFSINALTSEYLQRQVPPEVDNDALRERLALYKLSDLRFFAGLIGPLVRYLEEFLGVRERYRHVMRWEELLTRPTHAIAGVGAALGLEVDEHGAGEIWSKISWRNLTGAHRHNYRKGHGIVGGWRRYLVNEHLAMMRDAGLERLSRELGYGPILDLPQAEYTPYQRAVADLLASGQVFHDFPDPWLFEFAFNKSNLDSTAFPYRQYDWRSHSRIERSSMNREDIALAIWDAAEESAGRFNRALLDFVELPLAAGPLPQERLRSFVRAHAAVFPQGEDAAASALVEAAGS